ncbi:hypothetical protein K1719_047302, partial [Acacia pycnantha]
MLRTLSSTKEGEDAFIKIGQALDSIDYRGPKLPNDSHKVDIQIPSELITSCVSTLIMIQ